jgi:hypothetical protein
MSFERKVAFYESKGFDSKAAVLYAREDEERERQYDLKMKAIEQGNCRNKPFYFFFPTHVSALLTV